MTPENQLRCVLTMNSETKKVAIAHYSRFRVDRTLRRLPKRPMREDIGVSIWESRITLGNYTCAGTLEEFGTTDSSRVQ
jgi:hypothetical protein